jgi:hypothetical protein
MEHRCAFALENQAIAEFSADDKKKWDPEKAGVLNLLQKQTQKQKPFIAALLDKACANIATPQRAND